MQLNCLPFDLILKNPFQISHERRTTQPTIIVALKDDDGYTGLGEAPMTSYYGLSLASCLAELKEVQLALLSVKTLAPVQSEKGSGIVGIHAFLDQHFPGIHPFLRCALDVATHDLWAKRQGRRLGLCWDQIQPDRRIPTCYTIGQASIDEMIERLHATPWPIYKIKLGTDHDLAIIKALRAETKAIFRVDANTAWTVEQTLELAPQLKALGVEFIEQPLPADDWVGHQQLYDQSPLPIIADESCQTEHDVARCANAFHGINIKVVKCGGLLPARRMIGNAKRLGLKVMAGCMTESSVGISGIAQLVPELDYIDIDGALLLANDPAQGVSFNKKGIVQFPDGAGTGVVLRKR